MGFAPVAIGVPVIAQTFTRLQSDDGLFNRAQDNVQVFAEFLQSIPWLDGVLIEGVTINAGTTLVEHKLGREWRGWWLTDSSGTVGLQPSSLSTSTADRSKFIEFVAGVPQTVNIWVF